MRDGATSGSGDGALDALVEAFLERQRRGLKPNLASYLEEHPEQADELRQILPALVAMERADARGPSADARGPSADARGPGFEAGREQTLRSPGVRLGAYRIVREIGRGGMGTVFEAHQEPLGRRVALKVLSSHRLAPPDVERFRREAELASRLDHPAICTVYDSGIEEEVSYIAMRFVEGETLAQRIEKTRKQGGASTSTAVRLGDPPPRAVSTGSPASTRADRAPSSEVRRAREDIARVVRFVETIARGLHAAHEVGIVHRDVKPGNVMVTPDGEPVILDFGLARDLGSEHSAITRTGDLCGTPAYMSPEQIAGRAADLDRQTDVYSLGVSLFQCLTLRLPFEAPTREALYHAILTREPSDPRALNPAVPADLKAVIETALEKDRHRRYKSAADLADDLRRFLEMRTVHARPVGVVRRTARAARRNPGASAAISLSLALVIGAPTLIAWQQHAANASLLEQKNRAEAEGRRAYVNYREARDAVDKIVLAAAEDRMRDVPQAEPLRRELLEAALAFYQRVQDANSVDPRVRLETAVAWQRIARIQGELGRKAEADRTLVRAIADIEELLAEDPQRDDAHLALARCLVDRSVVVEALGRLSDAEDLLVRAAEDLRSAEVSADLAFARSLARAEVESELGHVQQVSGRPGQAQQSLRSALAIVRSLGPRERALTDARAAEARISIDLGQLLTGAGELSEAEEHIERGLGAAERIAEESPERTDLVRRLGETRETLAFLWAASGRTEEAEQEYTHAIADQERLVAAHPSLLEQRKRLAELHANLAALRSELGRAEEAEQGCRRALEISRELAGDFPEIPDYQNVLAQTLGNLAYAIQSSKPAEAEALLREATLVSRALTTAHPAPAVYQDVLANNLNSLGVLCERDHGEEAEEIYRQNLEVHRALYERFPGEPGYASDLGGNLHNLARMLARRGDRAEAARSFDEAICLQSGALAMNPRSPIYQEALSEHLESASKNLIELGREGEAARIAAQLPEWFPDSAQNHVIAASLLARCARAASGDDRLESRERELAARRHADDALDLLRRAVLLGYRDHSQLEHDEAFDALRERDDFRDLLAGVPASSARKQAR